jgi:hypothetical protein
MAASYPACPRRVLAGRQKRLSVLMDASGEAG